MGWEGEWGRRSSRGGVVLFPPEIQQRMGSKQNADNYDVAFVPSSIDSNF